MYWQVYQVTSSTYAFFDRHYGRSLGSEEAVFREGTYHVTSPDLTLTLFAFRINAVF